MSNYMHVKCILILFVQYFVIGNVDMVMYITVPSENKLRVLTGLIKLMGRIVKKMCVFFIQRRFSAAIEKSDQMRVGRRKLVLSYERKHTAMTDRTGLVLSHICVRCGLSSYYDQRKGNIFV